MASISVTYTFSALSTAASAQVNQNFTDIINGTSDGTKDFSINALTVAGAATLNGNVALGNATGDDITMTGSLASNIPIKTTNTYGIGSATLGMSGIYFGTGSTQTARIVAASSYVGSLTYTLPDLGTAGTFSFLEGTQTFTGIKTFSGMPAAYVYNSGSQTFNKNNSEQQVVFDTEVYDQASNFGSNTFTVPTGGGGIYLISASALWNATNIQGGLRHTIIVRKNSTDALRWDYIPYTNGVQLTTAVCGVINLVATDTIKVYVSSAANYSSSTVALNGSQELTYLSIAKIL